MEDEIQALSTVLMALSIPKDVVLSEEAALVLAQNAWSLAAAQLAVQRMMATGTGASQ